MGMRLGYACVHTELPSPSRTLRLARVTPERLLELAASNLEALEVILRWNAAHGIEVFRLASGIVPFGGHPVNAVAWWEELAEPLDRIGGLARAHGMQLSMHPGQFTVLGSPDERLVAASLADLDYHARLLRALGLGPEHGIVVHLGGVYGDRAAAVERWRTAFARLSDDARERLVVENDERWTLEETLAVGERAGVPVVLDVFHHALNPSLPGLGTRELVELAATTWTGRRPEVHFSTQEPGKRPGAHAAALDGPVFLAFHAAAGDLPVDCILELKDKQRSVLRAQALLAKQRAA